MAKDTGGGAGTSSVVLARTQTAAEREKEVRQMMVDASRRQSENGPEAPMSDYLVQSPGKESLTIRARSEGEAWAKYCDRLKHWPSPKTRTVRKA